MVTLRAEPLNLDESMATLRFAQRAKAVPVIVRANVKTAPPDPSKLSAELVSVTRELSAAKMLIEGLQRQLGAVGGEATIVQGGDDELRSAQLQVGQLDERMSELVEETREAGRLLWQPPPSAPSAASASAVSAASSVAARRLQRSHERSPRSSTPYCT